MKTFRGVFGKANPAIIVSAPNSFNLAKDLQNAREILLATAFARVSGWKLLKNHLLSGTSKLSLLTGLDFLQTEPKLLREWLKLTKLHSRIKAKIVVKDSIFHPKVLIVKMNPPFRSFAIVGSGNLTQGGLRTNIECSVYTNKNETVFQLEHWFEDYWQKAIKLREKVIEQYEPKYKHARKAQQQIRKDQKLVQMKVAEISIEEDTKERAQLTQLRQAVTEFKRYSKTRKFKDQYQSRLKNTKLFQQLLHIPNFNFKAEEFSEFYINESLGRFRRRWLKPILKDKTRLKKSLRYLVNENIPIENRVDAFLTKNARYQITGFNIAAISKILAVAEPTKRPIFNRAISVALNSFGYTLPRGLSAGEKYREFNRLANDFREKVGAEDFIAMDTFLKNCESMIKHQAIQS